MTGRPMHTAWYGFSKVIIADKRAVAQCDKCKKIITNPQKKRLENHNCHDIRQDTRESSDNESSSQASSQCSLDVLQSSEFQSSSQRRLSDASEPPVKKKKIVKPFEILEKIDTMKINDNKVINMLIVEFLIQWDIPFEAINSSTLQEAMKKLRPAFKLPSQDSIKSIIDEIYSQKLLKLQPSTITNATLILSFVDSTQEIIAFVKPEFGNQIFLGSSSMVNGFLNEIDLQNFIKELESLSMEKLRFRFTSIVENCINFELYNEFSLKSFTIKCQLKLFDEILSECSNVTLFNKIIKILHSLEAKSISQDPINWQDELLTLQYFVANIQRLKLQLAGNISIINGGWLSRELYDENLFQSATQQITKLQAIEKVLTSGELLSDKTAKWLELYQSTSLVAEGSNIYDEVFSDVALASYVLNPEYKSKHMSGHQKTAVKFFILDLVDGDQYKIFNDYLCEKNQFGKASVATLSSELFWKTFQDFCPGLAELALKITSLPAHATSINKKAEFKKVSSEIGAKISFIKFSKT